MNAVPMPAQEAPELPLSRIRVLDLSRAIAGPWVGQSLADFGAEVIKVEQPPKGDSTRTAPPFLKDTDGAETRESATFMCANRGKKSITVDLSSAKGQAIVRDLARRSDVLVENFKVGNLARYGLDYASIRALNPGIVYCSVTGFGQTGPYRHRAGYDPIAQAMGGIMSVTGEPDGRPGGGPMKVGLHIDDLLTGLHGVIGVLLALYRRDANGGEGQQVDVCLLDSQVSMLSHLAVNYLITGRVPGRMGTEIVGGAPQKCYPCSDAPIMVCVGGDAQFARFCSVLGADWLASDPRFATNALRTVARDELNAQLESLIATWRSADLLRALEEAGIPAGPINDLAQVFDDPQVRAREMVVRVPHPLSGDVPLVANGVRLSDTPAQYRKAPPLVGADTDDVLRNVLGLADAQIAALRDESIV